MRSNIKYTSLAGFQDKLGQSVHVGDVIAYATRTYDQTHLRVGEVLSVLYREKNTIQNNRYSAQRAGIRVRVKVPGKMIRMIQTPENIVLLTKKQSRVLDV